VGMAVCIHHALYLWNYCLQKKRLLQKIYIASMILSFKNYPSLDKKSELRINIKTFLKNNISLAHIV
jgi:hypothetical protein